MIKSCDARPGPLVKRLTGVLYPDDNENLFQWVLDNVSAIWGTAQLVSDPVPFDRTDYYYEIAPHLLRRFICFHGLVDAGGLPDWKNQSIAIEAAGSRPEQDITHVVKRKRKIERRTVNIDPGYIDGARLILASTKDHAHRVWLRDGIYAEVTMRYRFGRWTSFDYTFPDFASGVYDPFLSQVRDLWLAERTSSK